MADKPLQAGDLDRRGDLLQWDEHKDTTGLVGQSLSAITRGIYCKKEDGAGDEKDVENRTTALAMTKFTMRYRPDITEKMVWRFEGQDYDIKRVAEGPGRRQWTVIACQRRD